MKTRHLVLGLAIVLALSLAVPAFGGSIGFRPGGTTNLKSMVRRALKTTSSAQGLAAAAQGEAAAARNTASGAEATAAAARAAAGEAQGIAQGLHGEVDEAQGAARAAQSAAASAQSTAEDTRALASGAQGTADDALGTATQTAARLTTIEDLARNALAVAQGKVGRTIQVSAPGHSVSAVGMEGKAECPPGTFVSGGGYALAGEFTGAAINEPEGNGWLVKAGTEGLTAWALCVEP